MTWQEKYQEWQKFSQLDEALKDELAAVKTDVELEDRFYRYLEFGTGGMRGELGAGTNRINEYTIKRVALGLAQYIKEEGEKACNQGVVISFDNRRKSAEFAEWTARILASQGIHVYLSDRLRPTPELSYLVRHYQAFAGVMITASHNPKQYNGFKVYGSDGGQITLETAQRLMTLLEDIQNELTVQAAPKENYETSGLIQVFSEEADQWYLKELESVLQDPQLVATEGENLSIIYTPLHGTGKELIKKAFHQFGFSGLKIVADQENPDPDFSTVASPNPEDKAAFALALEKAKKESTDLLLATDPDADRLGVVVFNEEKPVYLNGNQIGVLLFDYLICQKKAQDIDLREYFLAKTIVTSDLGAQIAAKNGIQVRNTLTGFKFIGEQITQSEKEQDKKFLFGYEESFGYLIAPFVRDKDAIQAATLLAETALFWKQKNVSLMERLNTIYQEYGYYQEFLETKEFLGKNGAKEMNQLVEELRRKGIETIAGNAVVFKEDYELQTKSDLLKNRIEALTLPKSNVIKLILEDGSWICVRPSGTEPKFKIYYSVNADSEQAVIEKIQKIKNAFHALLEKL